LFILSILIQPFVACKRETREYVLEGLLEQTVTSFHAGISSSIAPSSLPSSHWPQWGKIHILPLEYGILRQLTGLGCRLTLFEFQKLSILL